MDERKVGDTCYDLYVNQLRIALGSGTDLSVKIIDSKTGIPFGTP